MKTWVKVAVAVVVVAVVGLIVWKVKNLADAAVDGGADKKTK